MAIIKKKRNVEIYFVLYLAALLFLLPDKRDIDRHFLANLGQPIYQQLFTLIPEKTTLTCKAYIDSTGPKILSIDSVNTIFYSGDVDDVRFDFEIVDQSLGQSFKLTSDTRPTTRFFKYEEHPDQQAAVFFWTPPLAERVSKTYLIKVIATANSRGNSPLFLGQKKPSETPQTFRVMTQFSLILIFLNGPSGLPMFPENNLMARNRLDSNMLFGIQNFIPQFPVGKVMLSPINKEVRKIAYQQWTNEVYAQNVNLVTGINKPLITFSKESGEKIGEARIQATEPDHFIIQGKTPSFGKMKVTVQVTRKYDGEQEKTEFVVSPQLFEDPTFDNTMYPDQTYWIDPKIPLAGTQTAAYIKDGNNIRAQSLDGYKFSFTPDKNDIGKTLYLERYVDNNLLGSKLPIYVLNFPEPEILEIREINKNEIDVQTRAFGLFSKEHNEIVNFEIQGNARYQDLRGALLDQKDPPVRIQHFRFTPADPGKPFEFKIIAVDKRGIKSYPKNYKSY